MRRRQGFTLLELLVAVGLLALLVFTLSLIFSHGLKALRVGYNRAEMYASARTALDQVMREIPTAVADGTESYPFVGFDKNNPGKLRGADSVAAELYFMGQVSGDGKGDVVELGYWLRRANAADAVPRELMRFYVTDTATTGFELYTAPAFLPDFSTPGGASNSNLLTENVTDLVFLYHYRTAPNTWADPPAQNWDSRQNAVVNVDSEGRDRNPDGLPNAVEVRVTVQDKLQKESPRTLSVYVPLEV